MADSAALVPSSKRQRTDGDAQLALATGESRALAALAAGGVPRTSSLDAPTMLLTGHADAVTSVKFSPDGAHLVSGSLDKSVLLWSVRGECHNFMVLMGHKNAVLEVQWAQDGAQLLSCSADKTVRAWDAQTGQQVKKMGEHTAVVNAVAPARKGPPLLVSGSDDGTVRLWDVRVRRCVQAYSGEKRYAVTAVAFAEAADAVYAGGLDNVLRAWDLRTGTVSLSLQGHTDTITGVALSADGAHVLTNAMDATVRVWDVRPYAPAQRCVKTLTGHTHNFEKALLRCAWSPDGTKVTAGSADRNVYIWDVDAGSLLYKLPGHKGSVNEVVFHPTEPIVGSASADKTIYLGELAK